MVNYQEGKIYRIVCGNTGMYYIGSTALKYLSQRLQKHLSHWKEGIKNVSSFRIFENGNFKIELIEMCPCDNVYELRKREGEIIMEHKSNPLCVNNIIEYGLRKAGNPEWYKEYASNEIVRDKMRERSRKYRQTDKGKEYNKLKKKEEIICECGTRTNRGHHSRHRKTKVHLKMLELMKTIEKMFIG